ncbi:DUF4012 domain-containing protein [Patescibacteria group bacterium]|nr:DUF4012 domain-containing protein [Patescibacteria group bacterium]MBU1890903.1 DUF4012 domain-containing protein [Patescibacteria group bacterium]
MINFSLDKKETVVKNPKTLKKDEKVISIKDRRKLLFWISPVFVIILFVAILYLKYGGTARSLMAYANEGKDHFYNAQSDVTNENYNNAAIELGLAQEKFSLAIKKLEKMGALHSMPYVNKQIVAVDNILKAGLQTGSALEKIALLADEIITPVKTNDEFTLAQLSPEQKREILRKISEAYPDLVGVKAEVDLAAVHLNQIPEKGILPMIKNAIEPIKEQLPEMQSIISTALPAVEIVPNISGYPEEQTYLFLLENNAELRPAGGFIGTYGILKLKDGEIVSFTTDNIYNLDNPNKDRLIELPPEPLQKYLNADKWFMRDSNWSPDFPTSAEKAIWFYHQEGGAEQNIHGVIAVTPKLIESLLGLTGEIQVDGITFTQENFTETLQYQVEQGFYRQGISDAERKEVIGDMADELLDRLLNLPQAEWGELWQTIENHIEEKHIILYSRNVSLQTVIEQENWGGQMREASNEDYLFVVDANMASLKTDPLVKRTIDYSVNESDGELVAELNIKYDHTGGGFDWKSTRYRTYTRVYIPKGSELLDHSGVMENDKLFGGGSADPIVYEEDGKTVIGGFISIEPQNTGVLHYRYKLPDNLINNKQYNLTVQKQAGTDPHTLNINLDFDDEIFLVEPIDKITDINDNGVTFHNYLGRDRQYEITFK